MGLIENGKYNINYNDGDEEILDITEEVWKYEEDEEVAANNCSLNNKFDSILKLQFKNNI